MQVAKAQETTCPYNFKDVSLLMEKAVADGVFPGAVLLVGSEGQILHHSSHGFMGPRTSRNPEPLTIKTDTVFDVAALTNVVVTTTICMKLVEEKKMRLEDRVSRYIQGFGVLGKAPITIGQLLSHSAGLVHWHPYYEELLRHNTGSRLGILTSKGARDYIYNSISRLGLKSEPGSRQTYSDIGFILLGALIETLTGLTLDKAAVRYIFQPLGLRSTSYIDLALVKRRGIHPVQDVIAPTEDCPWRKRVLCGEVHDDNAWAMGGIAGHSGLFTNARDLHTFASALVLSSKGESDYLDAGTIRQFWQGPEQFPDGSWKFGWDSPSRDNGLSESGLSSSAVGHCGFTGCSIWIEPERNLHVILLSNRIHPTRSNKKIFAFRAEIHNAVLHAVSKS